MGLDLIVQAKSGTGKTCVFAVILLQTISSTISSVQALVLAPTRELAYQTRDVIRSVARFMSGVGCEAFVGGLPTEKDIAKLKHSGGSLQVVAGTPGRLRALVEAKHLDLSALRQLVLDEVDVLLEEEGMRPQVEFFFKASPRRKQILAVSATFTDELLEYLHARLSHPQVVNVIRANVALKGVKQFVESLASPPDSSDFNAKMEQRMTGLVRVLESTSFHQCIVFTNSRTLGQRVCLLLERLGFPSSFTCGDLPQPERLRALDKLRNFEIRVLVSSDVSARGIDVDRINMVVNLELPSSSETYLHRIGRTGRFGTYGVAVTITVGEEEKQRLEAMSKSLSIKIDPRPDVIPAEFYDFDIVDEEEKRKLELMNSKRAEQSHKNVRKEISRLGRTKSNAAREARVLLGFDQGRDLGSLLPGTPVLVRRQQGAVRGVIVQEGAEAGEFLVRLMADSMHHEIRVDIADICR
uniref:RNA helicase n=1 Tax=Hanusia phi TaxID=3032 RepID=A0A7S0F1H0_9CRYP